MTCKRVCSKSQPSYSGAFVSNSNSSGARTLPFNGLRKTLFPQHDFDSEFCATEKCQKLSCVHKHTSAQRVCTEGFDIGRRFLGCPLEGYEVYAFDNWLDDESHGGAWSVITKLAEDNLKLQKKLIDLECTIITMKQEIINQTQQMEARDKKELACVVVVARLAIFCALFTMIIRGFV
ncbi:hypothetical protein ZWY2020_004223 [Hordeum vulgare]|nr:hypothetical protein ZWY2020_004223 [Hordeum vulgare]